MNFQPPHSSRLSAWWIVTAGLGVPLSLMVVWWSWSPPRSLEMPTAQRQPPVDAQLWREERRAFFDSQIDPLILTSHEEGRKSIERCSDRIREMFGRYGEGIDPFVHDLTSTWTRLGVLKRMPGEWWTQDDRVEKFIQEKFEKHIFSEGQLNRELTGAMRDLREDLLADRMRLLSQIKLSISVSELPELSLPDNIEFEKQVVEQLNHYSSLRAQDSVYQGLAGLISSEVASTLATSLVVRVVSSVGTSAAASAATAGGATATGAATGAGGGSLGGPAGTAIGLGVGLVAGIAIDWWMTSRFQSELKQELRQYLYRLEATLLHGNSEASGLEANLERLIDEIRDAERDIFRQRLIGEVTT